MLETKNIQNYKVQSKPFFLNEIFVTMNFQVNLTEQTFLKKRTLITERHIIKYKKKTNTELKFKTCLHKQMQYGQLFKIA